jgi:arylsulfatase A-like enzyme
MLHRPALLLATLLPTLAVAAERPNVLWIVVEDMSPHFACYGETTIETPHVDRLASEGVRFTRAFTTAPVCSTCRSALVTGTYQTSIGAHHHRSGRGTEKIELPDPVVLVPQLFQRAGYHTSNGAWPPAPRGRIGKTDYNFEWDAAAYDAADWSDRKPGQPFFAQLQLRGGKHRGGGDGEAWPAKVKRTLGSVTDPDDVTLPPYYPDDPILREDWAQYLDACRVTDHEVGEILDRLKREGLLDSTYVFFLTDHGISHARGKQFCYEEGMRIPLIVRGPGLAAGSTRDDLALQIDLAASSLAFAGIAIPEWMPSVDLFAADHEPRAFVVSARDRCDETVDHIRAVRTPRFKYIRNFLPQRPYLQPNAYKDNKPIVRRIRELDAAGRLNETQSLVTAQSRAPEELYDLEADPWELHNLAADPAHAVRLRELRATLDEWIVETGDRGATPEPAAMYDSDMEVYLQGLRTKNPDRLAEIEANIATMKRWAAAGK